MILSYAFLPGFAAAAIAAATPAPVLLPSSEWTVDYREDECLASRNYATLHGSLTFAVQPAPDGETYKLAVILPHSASPNAEERRGIVDFGHGAIKAWLLSFGSKDGKSIVYQFRITAAEMAQAQSAGTVTLTAEGGLTVTLGLKDMPDLLGVLQHCTTDLMAYWNADGEKSGMIAAPSKGDVRSVFTADDYPADAVKMQQEGSSQFRLMIDEKGLIAGCDVVVPSGIPVFDAMGCQVIKKKARFKPARDSRGNPVRSTVLTPPVNWRLE